MIGNTKLFVLQTETKAQIMITNSITTVTLLLLLFIGKSK